MGWQILFHMLPQDSSVFISFVQQRDPVVLTEFTANCAEIEPIDLKDPGAKPRHWLCFWNTAILPSMKRVYVPESNVGPAAYDWHKNGGLLLPFLSPPINEEWRERIHAQHLQR